MVSGRHTLGDIEESISDLNDKEVRLTDELAGLNGQHIELIEERANAFRELAELRARNALADGVIDQLDQLNHNVVSLLAARQKSVEAFKKRDLKTGKKREELLGKASALLDTIEDFEKRLDEAAEAARTQLSQEKEFKALQAALDDNEKILEEAERKTKQAEEDRAEKGKAYETDPLFMYLWKCDYRGRDYLPNPLIRIGDDWVAKLVGYNEARANYAVLQEIPERLREHCKYLSNKTVEAKQNVEDAEAARIEELAGPELISDLTEARTKQDETKKALETVEAERVEIAAQLRRYAAGQDDAFKKAIKLSVEILANKSLNRLRSLARATLTPTDDQIVSRIERIAGRADDTKRKIAHRRGELEQTAERREELLRVAARFRRKHYDEPGSIFHPDNDLEDLLEEFVRGVITGIDYWERSNKRHKWVGRRADSFRRKAGFPPFGRGRDWDDDDDDFRTGGSF